MRVERIGEAVLYGDMTMRGGTLFSGIGAPECAAPFIDWRWAAEIDPFASAVHAARFPGIPNLGDVTKVDWNAVEPVDLLVFGSPCQAFSVAGKRQGLDDPRGDLTLVALGIARRLAPRWLVWENVPGVLSIDGGRTFGTVLGILGQLGYGFAYRVLDAQFFGVPQRRRRVFVVGCLGDWRAAAAVLFERESLRRDLAPRREAGEGVARYLATGTNSQRFDGESETFVTHSLRADGFDAGEDGTGRGTPLVPVAFNWQSGGDCRGLEPAPVTMALSREQTPAIAFSSKDHGGDAGALAPTLRAGVHSGSHANAGVPPAVAFMENGRHELRVSERTDALTSGGGKPGQGYPATMQGSAVRRLTPRECERLQGFPDDWTAITYRNKPAADGPRYRALGNSMAVPVMRWIIERIAFVDAVTSQARAA